MKLRIIKGFGTDERAIIDILCSRDAKEINELKDAYQRCNYYKNKNISKKFILLQYFVKYTKKIWKAS